MKKIDKVCRTCGKAFVATCHNKAYCSQECLVDARRERERLQRMKHKKQSSSLIDIAVEARKHGMSYGQYVAWKGL